MRACHTNCCPVGIATQKPELRQRLPIDEAAQRLSRFLGASVELMQVMARACGHSHLQHFKNSDLSTWKESMARLAGVSFGGVGD
jgi:glutamate synthase domain-containing protein 2